MAYTDGQGLDYFTGTDPENTSPISQGAGWIRDIIRFLKDPIAGLLPSIKQRGVPAGAIAAWVTSSPPDGWLLCNGATIGSSTSGATFASDDYEDLFEVLKLLTPNNGTESWASDQTVVLPDLRRKYLLGGGGTVVNSDVANTLGATGGIEEHVLTEAQMPTHGHDIYCIVGTNSHSSVDGMDKTTNGDTSIAGEAEPPRGIRTNSSAGNPLIIPKGGGESHPQLPPTFVVNFIIKY